MIALGLSLISLIALNINELTRALMTPWQLPVITASYFIALLLTHLHQPSRVFLTNVVGRWAKPKDPKPTNEKGPSTLV